MKAVEFETIVNHCGLIVLPQELVGDIRRGSVFASCCYGMLHPPMPHGERPAVEDGGGLWPI